MKIIGNKCGAISIFLIIIFTAMLAFAGLMVDISRVMVAERKIDNALHTAVRSVLAEYDPELVGQFGLYGVDFRGKEQELQRYFGVNLAERHQNFHFLQFMVHDVVLHNSVQESLLNDALFREQIQQYMQYKGLLVGLENMAHLFAQGSWAKKADLFDRGQKASTNAKTIMQGREILNEAINKITSRTKGKAREKVTAITKMKKEIAALQSLIAELVTETEQANRQVAELKEGISGYLATINQGYGETAAEFASGVDLEKLQEQLQDLGRDLVFNQEIWNQIVILEEEMVTLWEEDLVGRVLLEEQRQLLYSSLRPLDFLDFPFDLGEQISWPRQEMASSKKLLTNLAGLVGQKIGAGNRPDLLISPELFWEANQQGELGPGFLPGDLVVEDDLKGLAWHNDLAEKISGRIFNYWGELNQGIQQAMQSNQDRLYLTEYIMDKYTFVTSPVRRDHLFAYGEVEYILCGNEAESLNLTQICGRIWSMRWAINTVEHFTFSVLPSFSARLAEALVSGFALATNDLIALYRGEAIPLCASLKSSPLKLSYSDHLRLFLLMQNEKTQLDRARQLMQINLRQFVPDFELKNQMAQLTGEVDVSLNLWFAPLLQLDKLGLKQIEGQRYHFQKTAVVTY